MINSGIPSSKYISGEGVSYSLPPSSSLSFLPPLSAYCKLMRVTHFVCVFFCIWGSWLFRQLPIRGPMEGSGRCASHTSCKIQEIHAKVSRIICHRSFGGQKTYLGKQNDRSFRQLECTAAGGARKLHRQGPPMHRLSRSAQRRCTNKHTKYSKYNLNAWRAGGS